MQRCCRSTTALFASQSMSFDYFRIMKMLKGLFVFTLFALCACSDISKKTGEVLGESGSEFLKGVSDGTGLTLDCTLHLSEEIQASNIFNGHFDANIATVEIYAIFPKDMNDSVRVLLKNEDGLEYARSKMFLEGSKGDGKNINVVFDEHISKGTQIWIEKL